MKKIVCTSPADNWFHFSKNNGGGSHKVNFMRVAVWATYDDGETVGLLGLEKPKSYLLSLPPDPKDVAGGYVHWDDLNEEEKREALEQCRIVPSFYR
ncbi:hypothetical protein [Enterovibrio paralichthyis]|uniref:hypothetical protein n=1 Tax=Enterovibrio paralichthyis TaxID=2853805 RepID=UPI001C47333B|nr:hypothetical protein [Enterovibrio paralichthyis]MBV7297089.1 hypothetical protein [Enterovibrio paralichthyis]